MTVGIQISLPHLYHYNKNRLKKPKKKAVQVVKANVNNRFDIKKYVETRLN